MKIGKLLRESLDRKTVIKVSVLVIIFTVATAVVYVTPLKRYTDPRALKAFFVSWGYWAPVIFVAVFAVKSVVPFPSSILALAGGLVFGPFYGAVYSIVGSVISASIAYQVSRRLGRDFVNKVLGTKARTLDRLTHVHGLEVVLFFRMVPSLPFDVFNLGAGLSDITFRDFFIGTALGMIPWSFALSYLGDRMANLRLNFISLLSFFLIIAIFVLPLLIKKFGNNKKGRGTSDAK
ncbi:MAG: TVP38/TMEM64 family protein [Deltaproteobacteria bacterium]|nr:TVP38/TMEM64 family protein [Deltaproteobacteria bacterium]MCL5277700.1 TVP38/TMEM64 family protein [Deltaproteobacteria bacterium]